MRRLPSYLLIGAALFAGWIVFAIRETHRLRPGGQTLAEHLREMPKSDRYCVFDSNGVEHLAAIGPHRSLLTFPSGPAIYVFDRNGNLSDWTMDEGDDPRFHGRWPNALNGREISLAEAQRFAR